MQLNGYQKYERFKPSDSSWIGDVPDHWSLKRLKSGFRIRKRIAGKLGFDVLSITQRGIRRKDIDSGAGQLAMDYSKYQLVEIGDFAMNHMDLLTGFVDVAEFDGVTSPDYRVFTLEDQQSDRRFWLRVFQHCYHAKIFYPLGQGAAQFGRWRLPTQEFNEFISPFPPLQEQQKIAQFLDHETAKIDTLIDKQQQLIALLKEKRQAVISHAVSKGLDPDAEMRDSGVEWLGDVPAHWVVSKFGYISSVVRGGSPRPAGDPLLFNGDYSPWVTVAEITRDDTVDLVETETFLTRRGSEQCRVFRSDTLLISNSGATLGVPKVLKIDANANDGVVGFENMQLSNEFAYFYLMTCTDDLRERTKQGSGQPNLNTEIISQESVPVPPEEEVVHILEHIRVQEDNYRKLKRSAEIAVALLKEKKSALISAAVTGKIDVRDWQPPTPQ